LGMGVIDLLCVGSMSTSVDSAAIPETLLQDVHHIRDMRSEVNMYVVTSSVISIVSAWGGKNSWNHSIKRELGDIILGSALFPSDVKGIVCLTMTHIKGSDHTPSVFETHKPSVSEYKQLERWLMKDLQGNNSYTNVSSASPIRKLLSFGMGVVKPTTNVPTKTTTKVPTKTTTKVPTKTTTKVPTGTLHDMAAQLLSTEIYASITPRLCKMVLRLRKMITLNIRLYRTHYPHLICHVATEILTRHLTHKGVGV
jgi:hypothetical protein